MFPIKRFGKTNYAVDVFYHAPKAVKYDFAENNTTAPKLTKDSKRREIVIVSASRAEAGLLKPIMTELLQRQKEVGDVHPTWYEFDCTQPVHEFMEAWESFVKTQVPDIVLVPTDRGEMVHIASYCFNNGIIVAHLHAGDFGSNHPDEMNRRAISCFSHIMFCETVESQHALWKLGEEKWRTFCVGSTAFDGITKDESLVPEEPYDLVLLHPDPVSKDATIDDLKMTLSILDERQLFKLWGMTKKEKKDMEIGLTIWLRPNKDKNHEVIDEYLDLIESQGFPVHNSLPRPQFLGLLKNCARFISNSSSVCYEAPYLHVPTVRIGKRNADRPAVMPVTGGAKHIATILATIPLNDKLRRKKLKI